jgi:ADP-heptose:LPS heptosyltransferase
MRYMERLFAKDTLMPSEIQKGKIKRILVVRPHDQLGDFLLSTPALRALRNHFPEARIGIVVRSYSADAMQNHPCVDEIIIFYENMLQWTFKRTVLLARQLIHNWDLAVVLSSESHSLTSDLLATVSGARYILGSAQRPFPGCSRNFLYNLIAPDLNSNGHQSERNVHIVRYIGAETSNLSEMIYITDQEKKKIQSEYNHIYHENRFPVIGLHVGANKKENRWPIHCFCELAERLHEKYRFQIVAFWGPKEEDLGRRFLRQVRFKPGWIEPSSLRRQAVHFSLCDLVVCNDTGIMHLCAAVGTPLVAVFGPTDPKYWKPIGNQFIAVRSKDKNTESVKVQMVQDAIESQIAT